MNKVLQFQAISGIWQIRVVVIIEGYLASVGSMGYFLMDGVTECTYDEEYEDIYRNASADELWEYFSGLEWSDIENYLVQVDSTPCIPTLKEEWNTDTFGLRLIGIAYAHEPA